MDLKSFVNKDSTVEFLRYRKNYFFYGVKDITKGELYEFPVPIEDVGDGTLLRHEKSIHYMRWIRQAIEDKTLVKA